MKKFTIVPIIVASLGLWSYLTILISEQAKIDKCLDGGGSWARTKNECIYIDKSYLLGMIEMYETKKISSNEFLMDVTTRLERQFKIDYKEASSIVKAMDQLHTSDSLTPAALNDAKRALAEK